MGSVLSFPFLCSANFICFYRAVKKKCFILNINPPSLNELPVLINGDDILFLADAELYQLWFEEIKLVGFELSPGKNLTSSDYFTINSSLYKTDLLSVIKKNMSTPNTKLDLDCICFKQIPYINPNFILGSTLS